MPACQFTQRPTPIDNTKLLQNQAHTCKTLSIVTKPKSIASTHAQMRPRNIIHARAITFVLATTAIVQLRAISRARHVKHHAS